ncbi:winged helix DNA-binding domain-containing protein [Streptomyces sp. NBC_00878]|uniref:winged helix DNA-binding domain-containing protein n=1 Tax=Streptomyces sp. NBC_00878 TaxID=2975854 RepID=UPI002259F03E|nr:winged helix DNA-binding domain-containing protein [Streptomyces sp. NBC_00878]MCX4905762.1 winged helix DNA-binding domain-containing protein [Streptomyces sp. NBC_00878]
MTSRITRITWDEAGARRYERQLLRTPAPPGTPVAEVVGTLLAAHAQVLSAAELSVGLRLDGATRQDVRAALWDDRSLVKTYGPRGTIHLLAAAELPFWSAALTAVPSGKSAPPGLRMTPEQEERVIAAIGDALDGRQLTIDELSEEVVARTGPWAGDLVMEAFQGKWPRWRQVMHRAGQSGALCFAPDHGRKATYTRPPRFDPLPADEALALLVRHYLRAYGPATPPHFAKWAAAPRGWAADLFASLASSGGIEEVDFEGAPAWVVAGDTEFPSEAVRGVRLLPYFDAYAIAAQPRERMFPGAAYGRALAGGQAGNYPVLLVDGVVAGVWHQRRQGKRTTVTVEPLGRLSAVRERELGEQVVRVGEVLEARAELVVGKVTSGPHA